MRKLRLAVIVPVIQVAVAICLLRWADRLPYPKGIDVYFPGPRQVCVGINAPAFVLGKLLGLIYTGCVYAGYRTFGWLPDSHRVFGLGLDELLFLPCVVLLWYLVGRALDRWRSPVAPSSGVSGHVVVRVLLLALAAVLFRMGWVDIPLPRFSRPNDLGARVAPYLTLTWALGLFFIGGRGLWRRIRPSSKAAR